MALNFNDPYGGGQQLVEQGQSKITPSETYGVSAEGMRSTYSDSMRNASQLTDALSGFGRVAEKYQKKQEEEELKQANVLAASVVGDLKGDRPVAEEVAARFPTASTLLQARVSETLGMWHATTQSQKFIEQALTDKTLTTPEAVQARLAEKLAEESARVGKQHFYGPTYIDTMSKLFLQRGSEMAAGRVREMEDVAAKGLELRSSSRIDSVLGPKGDGVGATTPPPAKPAGTVNDAFSAEGVAVQHQFDLNATYGKAASAAPLAFSNIVLHHATGKTADLVKYGQRDDPQRGGSFGYHFYIDPDGTIVQGAPMSKRTNHVKPEDAPQRKGDITGVTNNNSVGITLVGADRGHTPAQEAALRKLVGGLQEQFQLDPKRIFGHGELQSDRMNDEGRLAKVLRGGAAPAISGTADFRTQVTAAAKAAGVPDALIPFAVAQASLESGDGKSNLAKNGNNLFGVKADSAWSGNSITTKTTEVTPDGQRVQVDAKFRKYDSLEHSVKDWWEKIQKNYPETATAQTVEAAVDGLYRGRVGNYATAPKEEYLRGIKSRVPVAGSLAAYGGLPSRVQVAAATGTMSDAAPEITDAIPPASIQRASIIRGIFDEEDARFLAGNDNQIQRQRSKVIQIATLINKAEQFNDPNILRQEAGAIDWNTLSTAERQQLTKAFEAQQERSWKAYTHAKTVEKDKREAELFKFKNDALTEFRRAKTIDPDKWIRKPDGTIDSDKDAYIQALQKTSLIPDQQSAAVRDRWIDLVYEAATVDNWAAFAKDNGDIAKIINNGDKPTVDQMRLFFLNRIDMRPEHIQAINDKLAEHMDGAAVLRMDRVKNFYNDGPGKAVDQILSNAMLSSLVLMRNPAFSMTMQNKFNEKVMDAVKESIIAGKGVPRSDLGRIMKEAGKEVTDMVTQEVGMVANQQQPQGFTRPAPPNATPIPTQRWENGPDGKPRRVP